MRRPGWFLLVLLLALAAPAAAQLGVPNPSVDFPPPQVQPFGTAPHPLNNPHPTLPNAGLGHSSNYGQVIRQIWVPPRPVAIQRYVATAPGYPAQYETQWVEVPGYWILETTLGFLYPEHWTLVQANVGVYQWVRVASRFQPR